MSGVNFLQGRGDEVFEAGSDVVLDVAHIIKVILGLLQKAPRDIPMVGPDREHDAELLQNLEPMPDRVINALEPGLPVFFRGLFPPRSLSAAADLGVAVR